MKEALLSVPIIYQGFQATVGKLGLTREFLYARYLPYTPGIRVLDLGCGPGTSTGYFQSGDYTGLDISNEYLEYARKKFPTHRFVCEDFLLHENHEHDTYDLIFAMGLFHHLPDELTKEFLRKALTLLPHGGRLVSMDGCTYPGQSRISRSIVKNDRGRYVRDSSTLIKLAESAGFDVHARIDTKAYAIPYSTLVLSLMKK